MNKPDRIVLKFKEKSKVSTLTILCYYPKDYVVMKYNDIIVLGSNVNECLLNVEQYLPVSLHLCQPSRLYSIQHYERFKVQCLYSAYS